MRRWRFMVMPVCLAAMGAVSAQITPRGWADDERYRQLTATGVTEAVDLDRPFGRLYGRTLRRGKWRDRKGFREQADAIGRGLVWLGRQQESDGRWRATTPAEPGMPGSDVGATGLVLLAFLGDGQNLLSGPNADDVRGGVLWLCTAQDHETGRFELAASGSRASLDQVFATGALVETYGYARYPRLRRHVQLAVDGLEAMRSSEGFWRVSLPVGFDLHAGTALAVHVLTQADEFGLRVDPDALTTSRAWLSGAVDEERLRPGMRGARDDEVALLTADLFGRLFGQTGWGQDRDELVALAARLEQAAAPGGHDDELVMHLATLSISQVGTLPWRRWQGGPWLARWREQRPDGSWDSGAALTAFRVLDLEVNYRFHRFRAYPK